jgi:plastocyanin
VLPWIVAAMLYGSSFALLAGDLKVRMNGAKGVSVEGTVVELVSDAMEKTRPEKVVINQVDREFRPMISIIPVDSLVEFQNNDRYKHHVYSVSKGNEFDLPLYSGKPSKDILFGTPGVAKLGCNIHDWMLAYAYVSQSAQLQVADAAGEVVFQGVAAGEHGLQVWNPRLRNNRKVIVETVSIGDNEVTEHEITLSLRKIIYKPVRNDDKYEF